MHIVCADLEGVFVPEIWINVAEKTGIEELRLTTRDISDYDVLMKKRLSILEANDLKLSDITRVIDTMEPLPGAADFIDWLRSRTQIIRSFRDLKWLSASLSIKKKNFVEHQHENRI